ncbi:unnamed protein product, partial [Nesidiocoris tenuis]
MKVLEVSLWLLTCLPATLLGSEQSFPVSPDEMVCANIYNYASCVNQVYFEKKVSSNGERGFTYLKGNDVFI